MSNNEEGISNLQHLPVSDDNMVIYAQVAGKLIVAKIIKLPCEERGITKEDFTNTFDAQVAQAKEAVLNSSQDATIN